MDIAASTRLRNAIGDAPAEKQIRRLLDSIIATSQAHRGEFIKSYGDDVMAVFEGASGIDGAAQTAIASQRLAAASGLELYAGLHAGPVEFRQTMGHPDAVGLTITMAARMHKLTGAPGQIFLAAECVDALSPDLRPRAKRYGPRELKGVGIVEVWTLDWSDSALETMVTPAVAPQPSTVSSLALSHGANERRLLAHRSYMVGRRADAALCVPDPVPKVSTTHLQIEHTLAGWFIQDISRNGTWLRDARTGAEQQLPHLHRLPLPPAGELCLGRPFAEDPAGEFTVRFGPGEEP